MLPRADLDHVLERTRDLWPELAGGRIFVTGGTGFFGTWLLESLVHAKARLGLDVQAVVLTRDADAFRERAPHVAASPTIRFHAGDVRTFDAPAGEFTHVIHAATPASAGLNERDPLLMLDTIVEGTRRTLEFAARSGVKKVLLTSSGAVYGRQPRTLSHVPEDYAGAPAPEDTRSAYGEGKRMAEHLAALWFKREGLATKIARCFAFAGPLLPLDGAYAFGNFVRDALAGGPIVIEGDGTPLRSYLHAADLAAWLWVILCRGEPARPYNVGSEESVSIETVARTVAAAKGVRVEVRKQAVSGQVPERYVPATRRARDELGLEASIGFEAAVTRTLAWHR